MKKTAYTVITSYGASTATQYRRLYIDDDGKRYVKIKGEWKCVEGTKCLDWLIKD